MDGGKAYFLFLFLLPPLAFLSIGRRSEWGEVVVLFVRNQHELVVVVVEDVCHEGGHVSPVFSSSTMRYSPLPPPAPPDSRLRRTFAPSLQPYDAFLVLDVEATCLQGTDFNYPNEIIVCPFTKRLSRF